MIGIVCQGLTGRSLAQGTLKSGVPQFQQEIISIITFVLLVFVNESVNVYDSPNSTSTTGNVWSHVCQNVDAHASDAHTISNILTFLKKRFMGIE